MNHCWQAKNLLDQAVVQEKVDVVIASDPQGIKHDLGGWVTDSGTGGAAIGVFGNTVSVAGIFQDVEFVAARLNSNIHVVSYYVSPRSAMPTSRTFCNGSRTTSVDSRPKLKFSLPETLMLGPLRGATGKPMPEAPSSLHLWTP